jgi:hypothetical protein
MRRRAFIAALAGAAAMPLASGAQERERVRRVGVIVPAAADAAQGRALQGYFAT